MEKKEPKTPDPIPGPKGDRSVRRMAGRGLLSAFLAFAALSAAGCAKQEADLRKEAVAVVNSEEIRVAELREFLGIRGGKYAAADVPVDQKKEALERLVAGRLLAQEARARGLDNAAEFRALAGQNEQGVLITALFRKEIDARKGPSGDELKEEAKRFQAQDNSLGDEAARTRAERSLADQSLRKIEQELVEAAKKQFPGSVDPGVIDRIGKGQKVPDSAVVATAAGDNILLGDVKRMLRQMGQTPHGGQELTANPAAIARMAEREVAGKVLAAYAKSQGIEKTEYYRATRLDMERSILIDRLLVQEIDPSIPVTDRDVKEAYERHSRMFVQNGKRIPLPQVREQIVGFLRNEKRQEAVQNLIGELRKKGKVTLREELLPKV